MMPAPPPRPASRTPVFVLVAVAVLLAGAATWLFVSAGYAEDDARELTERAAQRARPVVETNRALVDPEATAEVTDLFRTAVEQTFSYDHANLTVTARAADRYLDGEARCQYDALFAEVQQRAGAQRLVLRTAVREIALVQLGDDGRAEALVFVDQSMASAGRPTPTGAGAQFAVRARLDDGTWRLTSFDFFGQSLAGSGLGAEC
ncbi:hypothetical protein [Actinophytocola sediminis]